MKIITKDEVMINKEQIKEAIQNEAIFIHPTDTIYGIGCNALMTEAVKKVREMKGRPKTPFSIIVPSLDWIYENCFVNENIDEWIKKLPGAITLILKLKNKCVSEQIAPELDTIGVRIPDHWFSEIVKELNLPIVTTSATVVGGDFMTSLASLGIEIKTKMDFIIYEGEKKGKPSKIIDLTGEVKIIER